MRPLHYTLACCAVALLSAPAFAARSATAPGDILAANNQYTLYLQNTKVDYAETGGSHGAAAGLLDTENGNVGGFGLSASSMSDLWLGNDLFQLDFNYSSGNTGYVGSYLNSNAGYGSLVSSSTADIYNYSFRYGKGVSVFKQSMLTPYVEVGHHRWERGLSASQEETYSHNYAGFGLLMQTAPVSKLVLNADLFYGRTFQSKITTNQYTLTEATLGNSSFKRYGIGADYAFSQRFHGKISYSHESYSYGISALNNYGYYEPNSTTKNTIYRVGIGYAF